jgi:AcrR family transcriptional regulator
MAESNHNVSNHGTDGPIWTRPEPATRQPRFSREQIATAALAIADDEGFEAVSMRRIARALGAGTMSLYRYIATKEDLLELIGDALMGEALVPGELPADWRQALAAVADQTRAAYQRHPWAVHLTATKAAVAATMAGPNALRHVEQSLSALSGAPMTAATKLAVVAIVDDYVFGHLLRAAARLESTQTTQADPAPAARFVTAQLASGQFPQLAAATDGLDLAAPADPAELAARFELGLRLLLDGIAASLG